MKLMIEELQNYITDWKTRKEVIPFLRERGYKVDDRLIRNIREAWNKDYCDGYRDTYFAYSNKGYKLTANPEEIRDCIDQDMKRGMKQIKRAYKAVRKLGERDQVTMLPVITDADGFEIILKADV